MKRSALILLVIICSAVVITLSLQSFTVKSNPVNIIGTWNLTSYIYNPRGGQMNFYFAENITYTFNSDSTGRVINNADTSAFKWKTKKLTLTLDFNSGTEQYNIIKHDDSELLIVDQIAGTDERRSYSANEKGLMFKK
ncbi:MAG: lipocalin family protein [Bacteroidota bacterium]|nr:lipocalin family protein [Bacteroidota bacterium]